MTTFIQPMHESISTSFKARYTVDSKLCLHIFKRKVMQMEKMHGTPVWACMVCTQLFHTVWIAVPSSLEFDSFQIIEAQYMLSYFRTTIQLLTMSGSFCKHDNILMLILWIIINVGFFGIKMSITIENYESNICNCT